MLEITERKVDRWAQDARIPQLRMAELDYRLCFLIQAIAADAFLSTRLLFKGGTALNKLYLDTLARLSVDLDYNHIGLRNVVQSERPEVLKRLAAIARDLDARVGIDRRNDKWGVYGLAVDYPAVVGGAAIRIKIEISTSDRVAILGAAKRPLTLPDGTTAGVPTLQLDELLATKLHATYARRKGRDVFDLHRARSHVQDPDALRAMAAFYFYRRGTSFDGAEVFHNLRHKDAAQWVHDDMRALLRTDLDFDAGVAVRDVLREYRFLEKPTPRELLFLQAAQAELGKIGPKRAGAAALWTRPLAELFAGHPGLSAQAQQVTWEEIRVHKKKRVPRPPRKKRT